MVQLNGLLTAFLILFLLRLLLKETLTRINIRHLQRHGRQVPEMLRDEIDEATLFRMTDYTVTTSRFASLEGIFNDLLTLAVLLGGILPWLTGVIAGWHFYFVPSGLLFFGILTVTGSLLDIPFDLYRIFKIEKRYGFSTMTFRLWLTDLLKSLGVSVILMGLLGGAFLALILYAEESWWFWSWLLFASFQLLMLWLYPVVIAPLFNRYEPIGDQDLKEAVMDLANRTGLEVS